MFGVSIHPVYGGWFAFRGVLIFRSIMCPGLTKHDPPDPVPDEAGRIELLRRFNECWQDWTFRDVVSSPEKYSEEQKLYFATLPKDRKKLVEKMISSNS